MMDVPYTDVRGRTYRYGEYFPPGFFPWAYNESNMYEWLPLSKEEALQWGFTWRDPDQREYQPATMKIPDDIRDVVDSIIEELLKCVACGKNYRLIPMELAFLRRMRLPVPWLCPLCRDRSRIKKLNPMQIYNRTCAKCKKSIQTSYAPDRPEIVYCEQCYNAEVV